MSSISTHVLDTTSGRPAAAVPVRLERMEPAGEWISLASAITDQGGRCAQLLPPENNLPAGRYRLVFDTAVYYARLDIRGLYPAIEISFEVRAGESHFHIPLLLSANSYTTYRGS